MSSDLGPIHVDRRNGDERFRKAGRKTPLGLAGFWEWSGSDLLSNAQRGILAEYIVACDLGVADGVRTEWDAFDLKIRDELTVEVKSAAYLQSWNQDRLSEIGFSVAPSRAWDAKSGSYDDAKKRQARVYVFCLLAHKDKTTVNPLDLDQWRFFVLPTSRLDQELGDQKRVSLSRLMQLKPREVGFGEIGRAIEESMKGG
jgi:hypothetical protein